VRGKLTIAGPVMLFTQMERLPKKPIDGSEMEELVLLRMPLSTVCKTESSKDRRLLSSMLRIMSGDVSDGRARPLPLFGIGGAIFGAYCCRM
jgi:hypothetical protein